MRRGLPPGVRVRHSTSCPASTDTAARCRRTGCGYQVQAGPRRARQTKTHASLDAAVAWKRDVEEATRRRQLVGQANPTVQEAGETFLREATAGRAATRGGKPYRPSTLRDYSRDLRGRIYPAFGRRRLWEVRRSDILALMAEMQTAGLSPSAVRNVINPLRAVFRFANDHDVVTVDPTRGLAMPQRLQGRRDRFAEPEEVRALLGALPVRDRALWATACLAGLRRGELMALRWSDVDLKAHELHVRRAWDPTARVMGEPKSAESRRTLPIASLLARYLAAHHRDRRRQPDALVFARWSLAGTCKPGMEAAPFNDSTVVQRANAVWKAAGLTPIGLHECRHTFASTLIQAGVRMKTISALMGHGSIGITMDLYGHLGSTAKRDAMAVFDDHIESTSSEPATNVIELRRPDVDR